MNRAFVAIPLLGLLVAGIACTGTPVAPSIQVRRPLQLLTEHLETAHFRFYYAPGDHVDVARSEAYHAWATAYLGVSIFAKIEYYKYRQLEDAYCPASQSSECLPVGAIGMTNSSLGRIYTSETWHPHECFHIYTRQIGVPPTFFNEGMATAHIVDPYSNDFVPRSNSARGSPRLSYVAAQLNASGQLVPITTLLTSSGWAQTSSGISYPEAGSFVRFLIDGYGLARMKQLFVTMVWNDSVDVVQTKFEGIYGISLRAAESDWRASLGRAQ
jgi:hypothetical protein